MRTLFLCLFFSSVAFFGYGKEKGRVDLSQYNHVKEMSTAMLLKKVPEITQKNIVFDMTGVLFYPSKKFIVGEVGWMRLLWYALRHLENPFNVFNRAFEFMNEISPPNYDGYKLHYKGKLMPKFAYDLLIGKTTNKNIVDFTEEIFVSGKHEKFFRSSLEKSMIQTIINVFFSPEMVVKKSLTPIDEGINLLKTFYEKKGNNGQRAHKLYLLTNFDDESFTLLAKKNQDLFKRFDGIMVSAHVGCLKPESKIYETFFDRFNVKPQDCFFIDDQADNIAAAQKLGMDGIRFLG